MKKLFIGLGLGALIFGGTVFGQNAKKVSIKHSPVKVTSEMELLRKAELLDREPAYASPSGSLLDNTGIGIPGTYKTQAINIQAIGHSGNVYSIIRGSSNQITVYHLPTTTVVAFAHRNDHSQWGGNGAWASGIPRFDLSVDSGATWSTNLGPLMVDEGTGNLGDIKPRYPQAVLTNPLSGNTVSDLRLVETGTAWVNTLPAGGADWGWPIRTLAWKTDNFTVAQLNDITANLDKWYAVPQMRYNGLIENSLTALDDSIAWLTNLSYNANGEVEGYFWYSKITFNSAADQLMETKDTIAVPGLEALNGEINLGTPVMEFSPDGNWGWIAFEATLDDNGDVTMMDSIFEAEPVFYFTQDKGATWNGPIRVNLRQFCDLTEALKVYSTDGSGNIVDSSSQVPYILSYDLTVDANGNPHLFMSVVQYARTVGFPHIDSIGYITVAPKILFDLTTPDNGQSWDVILIDSLYYWRWNQNPNNPDDMFNYGAYVQVGRSADGTIIGFSWMNDSTVKDGSNTFDANLWTAGIRLTDSTFASSIDHTVNTPYNGLAFFPQLGREFITKGTGAAELPIVFTNGTDPIAPTPWYYVGGIVLDNTRFTSPLKLSAKGCQLATPTPTSLQASLELEGIKVYPNPAKDNLFVSWENNAPSHIQVLDMQGRVLISQEVKNAGNMTQAIDFKKLPAGIYLLKVTNSKGAFTTKIVKE